MNADDLLIAQVAMRGRAQKKRNRRKTLVKRNKTKPAPTIVDLPTKIENGNLVKMCPPHYDKALEFDRWPRTYQRTARDTDEYEEMEEQWFPSKSVYKSLSDATCGGGNYLVLDADKESEAMSASLGLARQLVTTVMKYVISNKPLPYAWEQLLGCDIKRFRSHMESLFQPEMHWGNWGEWHIDHIKPLSSFSLGFRPELIVACNYRNLQPLWAYENLSKSNSII